MHDAASSEVANLRSVRDNVHLTVSLSHLDLLCARWKISNILTIYDDLARFNDNPFTSDSYRRVERTNLPRIPDLFRFRGQLAELTHDHMVRDVNFSDTGDYLVTACEDGAVTVWDAHSGEPLAAPLQHPAKVHSAVFDPEGKLVATGCDNGMVSVWNWRQGVHACPDLAHTTGVFSACFNANGRLLITAAEGEVRFWERFTGKQISNPRYVDINQPSLVMNRRAQVGVASSSHAGAIQAPHLVSVFNLREFDTLNGFSTHSNKLLTFAEVVSGRRVEFGGSTALTADEWWERWESLNVNSKPGSNDDVQGRRPDPEQQVD